ncbi:ribonuclease H-like domain-containing protein [Truncatella angustata]|uniref:Ribonuclease H-like domain-containing protein n=1 Tax=Truncatella angustata TaxID=152316 RepID=A0A9P8ZSG6_9PEZI|nr:ribonuclease H-like domain-containing protein [Truncatella angustata]KAH6647987.1 ribonuclease H-like domain-containing protein [Truncatella angustata]
MSKLSMDPTNNSTPTEFIPLRPSHGTKGKEVVLYANYFKLAVKSLTLYKYTLKVAKIPKQAMKSDAKIPEAKGRKLNRVVALALEQVGNAIPVVSEYKSQAVSLEPLDLPKDGTVQVPYSDEGRDDTYKVTFQGPTEIRVGDLTTFLTTMQGSSSTFPLFEDVIDAVGVVLGHYPRAHNGTASLGSGRHFPLNLTGEVQALGRPGFNTIIRGYFSSVRPATGRLLLNTNVSHGVFRFSGPIVDLMRQCQLGTDDDVWKFNRTISRLRVKVQVLSEKGVPGSKPLSKGKASASKPPGVARIKESVISGLADPRDGGKEEKPKVKRFGARPNEVLFVIKAPAPSGFQAGEEYTVAQYFQIRYGRQVDLNLPLVNTGTKLKPVYTPAELVEVIPGQALRRKTTPDETREMIEFSCRSPFANATSLVQTGRKCLGLDENPILAKFGVTVDRNLLTVKGRELPPPQVIYASLKNPRQLQKPSVTEGSWNMRDVKVIKAGKSIQAFRWIYINTEFRSNPPPQDVQGAMSGMFNFWRNMGIAIGNPQNKDGESIHIPRGASAIKCIESAFAKYQVHPQFLFVVLPDTGTEIYNALKTLADTKYGYHTVAMVKNKLVKEKGQVQYFANVGLKVNLKAGGINHKVEGGVTLVREGKTMVVGYDVTHPTNMSGDSENVPSMVGMVSSIEPELAQWPSTAWTQDGRVEMLSATLEAKFEERIRLWLKHNPGRPLENIVIYRDGVSESQFMQVLDKELPYIRAACRKLCKQQPKIALIVSVKRHQTRFYPTDANNMTSSRNIKNGTVVDRGVTLARVWDFFLTAHTALQGTARPAHYTVLLDEVFRSTFKLEAANTLEKITHDMCYLFGRATKAVSICPPAYYADIVCTRQRVHMNEFFEGSDNASTISDAAKTQIKSRTVHENLKDNMYYI